MMDKKFNRLHEKTLALYAKNKKPALNKAGIGESLLQLNLAQELLIISLCGTITRLIGSSGFSIMASKCLTD